MIEEKCQNPINAGNRKIIVFTAFSDTADYLYAQLAPWARDVLGVESALVTGSGRNQTTTAGLRKDLASILTAFSPRSKERPAELAGEGEIDLLFATDCISEGQNLQDCDWLINYDIHWNPVRIIQRFGRIDRIGSPNEAIQLVKLLAQHGAGGVHQPRAARQRADGTARHLGHRRGKPHRAAIRQPDE
ncbi:C-terminal helicase domain-containing protein [Denitromonas sp.]|uniref:C-terminal helicase domain-containing protein n=1 Tax=Denitromonas sp. TaxID=2734609 RepID=UPI002AFE8255|nr:C-terminal helicase domain-containing protein [Denitromonas sp.]